MFYPRLGYCCAPTEASNNPDSPREPEHWSATADLRRGRFTAWEVAKAFLFGRCHRKVLLALGFINRLDRFVSLLTGISPVLPVARIA